MKIIEIRYVIWKYYLLLTTNTKQQGIIRTEDTNAAQKVNIGVNVQYSVDKELKLLRSMSGYNMRKI